MKRQPPQACPHCKAIHDAASELGGMSDTGESEPSPGDFSICLRCGGILSFNDQLQFVARRIEDVPADIRPQLQWMQSVIGTDN